MGAFLALLKARNKEFYRDKGSLTWAILFPAFIIAGLYFAFSDDNESLYIVGVTPQPSAQPAPEFLSLKHITFVEFPETDIPKAVEKIRFHKLDLFLDLAHGEYWVNTDSRKGYFLEKILQADARAPLERRTLADREIRYLDWVIPGVLGMNMMFGCLFGVGYVIVRYRANGVLKRLKATPVTAFEFLSAQVVSRLLLTLVINGAIFTLSYFLLDFTMRGSWFLLLLVATLGSLSMIAMGLLAAARTTSLELSNGLLNILTWPMMLLCGVWFSLDESSPLLHTLAQWLPLTHVLDAARAIMLEGKGLMDIQLHLWVLAAMTLVFMSISTYLFRWDRD